MQLWHQRINIWYLNHTCQTTVIQKLQLLLQCSRTELWRSAALLINVKPTV